MDFLSRDLHEKNVSAPFARNREYSVFGFSSSLTCCFSPDGESLFLLRQEKEPKEGDPDVPVAARLPCDAHGLRRLRNSSPQSSTVTTQTVLADYSSARCASRRAHGDPEKVMSPHSGAWLNQKENETSLLLRLGPRWARREAQAGRELSVADV